jgi:hypothetical protein
LSTGARLAKLLAGAQGGLQKRRQEQGAKSGYDEEPGRQARLHREEEENPLAIPSRYIAGGAKNTQCNQSIKWWESMGIGRSAENNWSWYRR